MFLLSLPSSQWIKAKTQIVNTEESRVSLSLSNSSSMCVSLCACPNEKHFITESKQLTVCEHTGCISVPIISAGSDQASSLQESRGHIGYHSILPYPTHKYAHTHAYTNIPFPITQSFTFQTAFSNSHCNSQDLRKTKARGLEWLLFPQQLILSPHCGNIRGRWSVEGSVGRSAGHGPV